MAAYALDPWGPERADLNAGIITAAILNVNRDPRRGGKPVSPVDVMPKYGQPPENLMESPERLKAELLATFGGKGKRKAQI